MPTASWDIAHLEPHDRERFHELLQEVMHFYPILTHDECFARAWLVFGCELHTGAPLDLQERVWLYSESPSGELDFII